MNGPVTQQFSDSSVDLATAAGDLPTACHRPSDYLAALAGRDRSVQDIPMTGGIISASTRTGERERNLEGYIAAASTTHQMMAVINGLGTGEPGAFACRITGASIISAARQGRDGRTALIHASTALQNASREKAPELASQTGACIALAQITESHVNFLHLGNCRALLIRPDLPEKNGLIFASEDHTITGRNPRSSPTVTRALSPLKPDIGSQLDISVSLPLQMGDLVVLVSDGITRSMNNHDIAAAVRSELSIIAVSERSARHLSTSNVAAEILYQAKQKNLDAEGNQTIVVYKHLSEHSSGTTGV